LIIAFNDAFVNLANMSRDDLLKTNTMAFGVWRDESARLDFVDNVVKDEDQSSIIVDKNKDGVFSYYKIRSAPIVVNMEQAIISCLSEATEEVVTRSRCERTAKRFEELSDAMRDCYFCCDISGRFTDLNIAMCMLLGYSENELLSLTFNDILSSGRYWRDIETLYAQTYNLVYAETIEQEWLKKDRTVAHIEVCLFVLKNGKGEPSGFWGVARETSAYSASEKTSKHGLYSDQLTELPNRAWLTERLNRMIRRSRIAKEKIAILLVDIHRFRLVNDAYGYGFGDAALKELANLTDSLLRTTDLLARFDGDKFMVVVGSQPIERGVLSVLRRFLKMFGEPIAIRNQKIKLSARIGIGVFPADGEDVESLIKRVEETLSKIVIKNESVFRFVSDELDAKVHDRFHVEKMLSNAILSDQIIARYQPINAFLPDGAYYIVGAEAYARWSQPTGELSPNHFMEIADELGASAGIDRKIYEIALGDLSEWIKNGLEIKITINLSQGSLEDSTFAKWAIALAKSRNIDPKMICFDARYNSLVCDKQSVYKTVSELCAAGFDFCADDFGEETSLLSRLKKLGVSAVKVAPKRLRFIKEEGYNSLQSIKMSARSIGLELRVAGIEDESLERKANEAGAQLRQGFLYAKAMSAEEIVKYAREQRLK
jgi:diguanylate cyclase (GGDEF)-like protein/PAS domain S-box-containing protein